MKVSTLTVKNIGMIADGVIQFNKPLIILYGEIRQGKTTYLNAVRWVCGGSFPQDIIRHGEKEGEIELAFDGGCIRREFYRAKTGDTKARDVKFIRAGKPVSNPVAELKKFMNPFLLNQDHLRQMTETERKAYFTDMFSVDTSALDAEAFNCERQAQQLRATIKGYGDIDLTPIEPADDKALRAELKAIRDAHAVRVQEWRVKSNSIQDAHTKALDECSRINATAQTHNAAVDRRTETLAECEKQIVRLKSQLKEAEKSYISHAKWIEANPKKDLKQSPTRPAIPQEPQAPDAAELESSIQNAAAQNVRAEQFGKNKARAEQRSQDEKKLAEIEKRERDIKKEKIAKLKGISSTCGVPGLEFDEAGQFTYEGTQAGMLSTSQVMRLSSALSALYPEGFGLELLDRGESLGRAIFDYVEHAKANKTTVLATVVGQRPADAPDSIGVFVVKDGIVFTTEPKETP